MMKAAFAVWKDRIAPVFDVARQIHLVEAEGGRIARETQEPLANDLPVQKAIRLAELGAGTLVCGAISRPLQEMVSAYGIRVIPFVAGDLREVIQVWLTGGLNWDAFAMPGCRGRWRERGRFRGMHSIYKEEYLMNGRKRGGRGHGGGRVHGRGGQRRGDMDDPISAESSWFCVCPQCGQREPHESGVPCTQRKCPKCGAAMIKK